VLAQSEAEVWGLVEVVDGTRFHGLARSVANSATLLSSDSVVTEGPTRYGSQSQKLGLVYKTDALRFRSARLLATDRLYDFVGRPPLEARFTLTRTNRDITVVVVHLKADADPDSWQRRNACARWLKGYLDGRTEPTFVVGDFNDTLEGSLTPGQPSPFTPLTETRERYFFPTEVFGIVGISTQVSRRRPIDHHLVTHPLFPALVPDSAAVWRLDGQIARFGETVSDHYPVVSRYAWDRLAAP
jgi:endonuclease/exonuclease/phosphatase family metal-dependent hydrolase